MQKFIKEGEILLENYEWSGGIIPKKSVIRARWKLLNNNDAVVVKPDDWFEDSKPRKIIRKK